MALSRNLKNAIKQGIRETMEPHVLDDGIDKEEWTAAVAEWLAFTHPDFNEQLMITARDAVLRQMVNDYIRSTRTRDPLTVLDFPGIRREIELNNRIVQIRQLTGKFKAKRIAEVTLREIEDVVAYYDKMGLDINRRMSFYKAILNEMRRRGMKPDDRVSQLLLAA